MLPRTLFRPLSRWILQPYFRLTKAQTLGVRGVVRDEEGQFLLVRHTYAPGWMFPGGGIDPGESLEEAVKRELFEEVGVRVASRPQLVSVHTNFQHFKGDHVGVFLISDWAQEPSSSLEIAEWGFFSADNLPEETTGGTRRRIAEILEGRPGAAEW